MQSEDAAEPIEWDTAELKRSIDEWATIASQIIQLLHSTADAGTTQNWRPHAAQITAVVSRFCELCRRECQQLGGWREDGLAPAEAYERVRDQGDALVKWLMRMMHP